MATHSPSKLFNLFNPCLYPALLREYRQLSRRSTAGARQLPVASPE